MQVNFDWTITLGQVVQLVVFVVVSAVFVVKLYYKVEKRIDDLFRAAEKRIETFENQILLHANTLTDHGLRMERYETALFKVISDLQRTIGRLEMMQMGGRWDGGERRGSREDKGHT